MDEHVVGVKVFWKLLVSVAEERGERRVKVKLHPRGQDGVSHLEHTHAHTRRHTHGIEDSEQAELRYPFVFISVYL